jgi:hypothetical protein
MILILVNESRERVDGGPSPGDDMSHGLDINGGAFQHIDELDEHRNEECKFDVDTPTARLGAELKQ